MGSSCRVKAFSDVKAPSFNQGFSRACAASGRRSHQGEKKKFTHKATPARCASHYRERSCCIFLGSYMLFFRHPKGRMVSGTRLVTETVRSAFTRCKIALFNSEVYLNSACRDPAWWFTLGHSDQSMICAGYISCFSPLSSGVFLIFATLFNFSLLFCTRGNWHRKLICMSGEQEHTVWSGKPDIYGWEIFPKMCERKKSLSTSSGEWKRELTMRVRFVYIYVCVCER